jgi:subtilisin family serine protease
MSGTSMASPYVAGVAALMLSVNPRLTGAQIGGILQRTAQPLPGADFTWRNDYGSGRIAPAECVSEAHTMRARVDKT